MFFSTRMQIYVDKIVQEHYFASITYRLICESSVSSHFLPLTYIMECRRYISVLINAIHLHTNINKVFFLHTDHFD